MPLPVISVVIPCRDAAGTIGAQLDALARQEFDEPWELVVADNGSTDETRSLVQRYRERIPGLRIVDASQSRGVAYARNRGVAEAAGDVIAFCDDDDEAQPGWLAAMARALARHDFVAGRLDMDSLNEPWMIQLRGRPQATGPVQFDGALPYAIGCNLGIRREVHERIGGFDPAFLGGADDIDYSWRAQRAGATLQFEPEAVIAYRLKPTLKATFTQARSYAVGYVSLYARNRGRELPTQRGPWRAGLLSWAGLIRRVPVRPSKAALARFLWEVGWRVGMVEGSIGNRVVLLSVRGLPTASGRGGPDT